MASFILQQSLAPLRAKLDDLGDTLFDIGTHASIALQESAEVVNNVCQAVESAQTVFQRLDRIWPQLVYEDQTAILFDWESCFQALQGKLKAPCELDHASDAEERKGCASCRIKVKRVSDELKSYATQYAERLQPEIHFQR